eukprot:CAMPEP_0184333852 /NCGR_PEP_ID=MMETSP1089-20130417/2806_1 /TAXON_ID=38269 ORGANISM="Gloeochaete wittrockiana, Strain SAG46.84" /NCGR_SAMPLE_ID=MMETSP1089 /ASSEMBLY_ACC=CAM_ASM_000445 /LENGTH=297 /DNA_ID=CAMNT_0026657909 /DNA_START=32 /DNA_END=925 /DNA_ORIENTATION=+
MLGIRSPKKSKALLFPREIVLLLVFAAVWIIGVAKIRPLSTQQKIPAIVHFIFGLKDDFGGKPFNLIHFLAVKAAHEVIRPTEIIFYYKYKPSGEWWDRAKPYLTLVKVEPITNIYGNKVDHMSHRADILRLQILREKGGIYLDMDVIALKSFDQLLKHEFVMGQEGVGGGVGLCNAVMLSRPHSAFIERWMESYKKFDQNHWNHHSVVLPKQMAVDHAEDIHIINHKGFFWPLWNPEGLNTFVNESSYSYRENYAVHLWEQAAYDLYLKHVTPSYIRNVRNNLTKVLRRFLPKQIT